MRKKSTRQVSQPGCVPLVPELPRNDAIQERITKLRQVVLQKEGTLAEEKKRINEVKK